MSATRLADFDFSRFRRTPLFFILVTGILALGIADSVSLFSLVDGVLLRPLPYRDPQRLVALTTYATKPPFDSNGSVSYRGRHHADDAPAGVANLQTLPSTSGEDPKRSRWVCRMRTPSTSIAKFSSA